MKNRYPAIALLAVIIIRQILDGMKPFYGTLAIICSLCELTIMILFFLTIYTVSTNRKKEKMKRQREIEKKEIDVLRKSNEILLHLMHDNHREP